MFVRESIFRIMGTKIVLQHNPPEADIRQPLEFMSTRLRSSSRYLLCDELHRLRRAALADEGDAVTDEHAPSGSWFVAERAALHRKGRRRATRDDSSSRARATSSSGQPSAMCQSSHDPRRTDALLPHAGTPRRQLVLLHPIQLQKQTRCTDAKNRKR